jgi:hypothetical protein
LSPSKETCQADIARLDAVLKDPKGGCIQTNEPNSGQNWGKFCSADDVEKFKASYPNYRVGTTFIIKSGTIKRFLLGPALKDLEF